jgi:hypothetical protein
MPTACLAAKKGDDDATTNHARGGQLNILNFARRGFMALTAVAGLGAAPFAFANPVTLVPTGFANGSEPFNVSVPTILGSNPVSTGAFAGTLDGDPLVFFCFELTESFSFTTPANPYTYDDSVPSGSQFNMLSALFTEAFAHATDNAQNSAAFQLAVWEILEEASPKSLNPGADQGTFYVTNDYTNTATVTAATNLIAGLPASGVYTIHLLHNEPNQDFVYGVPTPTLRKVPEPGPLSLVAVALIALLAVRRRVGAKPAA